MKSDTNGRMLNARYGVDGLRTKKQDANGNSSREYGAGISTSASTPLTQNSTAPSISYISGPMILGAEINGEFVYHLGDALSTVRDVVDDEGDIIRSFEFDEYGNLLNSSGSGTVSPKTWIGGLSVNDDRADSGLWNMGHRNYDGVLGRFISRDPIGFSGSSLNLYAYPTNPVNAVDPSGLEVTAVFDMKTGTMNVTSTEGQSATFQGIFSGGGPCQNDPDSGHIPFKGPTPPGTYYIGDPISVQETHPGTSGDLVWLPIINQSTLSDRVFVADPATGKQIERNQMYIHPGSVSQGCVTFPNKGNETGKIGSTDFSALKSMLKNSTPITVPTWKWSPTTGMYPSYETYRGVLIVK